VGAFSIQNAPRCTICKLAQSQAPCELANYRSPQYKHSIYPVEPQHITRSTYHDSACFTPHLQRQGHGPTSMTRQQPGRCGNPCVVLVAKSAEPNDRFCISPAGWPATGMMMERVGVGRTATPVARASCVAASSSSVGEVRTPRRAPDTATPHGNTGCESCDADATLGVWLAGVTITSGRRR
jgi:hypothetical protein